MQKVMWDNRIVPRPNRSPKLKKSNIREIPVTISAFSMGIFVMPMMIVRLFFFKLMMEIQAAVPMTVAAIEATSAISNVLRRAFKISLLRKSA